MKLPIYDQKYIIAPTKRVKSRETNRLSRFKVMVGIIAMGHHVL